MDYNEYRDLTNLIDTYVKTSNRQTLERIQTYIRTKESFREKLMEDLKGYHQEYIQIFSTDEQVKIVSELLKQIEHREYLAQRVSWMLPYVSEKALDQILSIADDYALEKILHEIEEHIRAVGNRFLDLPTYFYPDTNNIFSGMNEGMTWQWLYRKCKRNLKK